MHQLSVVPSDAGLKFVDHGGEAFGQEVEGQEVQFRLVKGTPTPYLDIDFSNGGTANPIRHVVLGPKNDSIPAGISLYLETIGLAGVTILRSEASYQ